MTEKNSENSPNSAKTWSDARGRQWLDNIAQMEATLAKADRALIDALQLDRPLRIADIGCGGGGTSLAIAAHAPAGSHITGYDISPDLIAHARQRAHPDQRPNQHNKLSFTTADMGQAEPPETAYDRLTSRFGIMFFKDPLASFRNIRRFLSPNGRFAFAFWAEPKANPWLSGAKEQLSDQIAFPDSDPDGPGAFRYADAAKFQALMETAGFCDIALGAWRGKLPVGGGVSPEKAAQFAFSAFSSLSDWHQNAEDSERRRAKDILTRYFQGFIRQGIVEMDAHIHIMTGR